LFRSLLGRDFSDPELVHDTKALLYDVVNIDNQPSVKDHVNESDILFAPENISAMEI
jgi:Hsp70 protein